MQPAGRMSRKNYLPPFLSIVGLNLFLTFVFPGFELYASGNIPVPFASWMILTFLLVVLSQERCHDRGSVRVNANCRFSPHDARLQCRDFCAEHAEGGHYLPAYFERLLVVWADCKLVIFNSKKYKGNAMWKIAIVLMVLLSTSSFAHAKERSMLYKEYYYGMPKEEVRKTSSASDCKDDVLAGCLCMKRSVEFASFDWEQIFYIKNGKLTSILLVRQMDKMALAAATEAVLANNFILARVSRDDKKIDIIEYSRKNNGDGFAEELEKFELDNKDAKKVIYTFFEADKSLEVIKKYNVSNITEFTQRAPTTTRCVEITQQVWFLGVSFLAPIKAWHDMNLKTKEKF